MIKSYNCYIDIVIVFHYKNIYSNMSTKNKIIRAKSAKNTHVKTQSNSDSYASNLELTRYKLNQFYQSKFNEKRIKGELKYPEKTNNANTYFAKDSFIYEKYLN